MARQRWDALATRALADAVLVSEPTVEDCDHEDFPEAAYAEGEDHADDYTLEEWAAWEAGACESFEGGGAEEEYVEHFDGYDGEGYYSDDY
ncbi:hypothetical protein CYMTET_42666 [Cymbomonas tetramitiformis]|uniref:Uncharacterized protein n=1 Tax=Cymbomonas tetramitiformis TaxID=36881 RepID=A0AAE0F1F8_9CHLO|nr:hypothetical protein CYMTET_42666 [Cymbomonas tetramitiformis]